MFFVGRLAVAYVLAQTGGDPVVIEEGCIEFAGGIRSIAMSENKKLIAISVSPQKHEIVFWHMDQGHRLGSTPPAPRGYSGLRFVDEKTVVAAYTEFRQYEQPTVIIEWWEAGPEPKKLDRVSVTGTLLAFSKDSRFVLTSATAASKIYVVDRVRLSTEELEQPGRIFRAALSADAKLAATVSHGGTLRFWDVGARRELASTDVGDPSRVRTFAHSPNGRLFAADNRIWELGPKGAQLYKVSGAFGTTIAFAPNSKYLAYNGVKMIELYAVPSGQRVARFHPSSPIQGTFAVLAFSPDGTVLMAGDSRGKLRWWPVPAELAR